LEGLIEDIAPESALLDVWAHGHDGFLHGEAPLEPTTMGLLVEETSLVARGLGWRIGGEGHQLLEGSLVLP